MKRGVATSCTEAPNGLLGFKKAYEENTCLASLNFVVFLFFLQAFAIDHCYKQDTELVVGPTQYSSYILTVVFFSALNSYAFQ